MLGITLEEWAELDDREKLWWHFWYTQKLETRRDTLDGLR